MLPVLAIAFGLAMCLVAAGCAGTPGGGNPSQAPANGNSPSAPATSANGATVPASQNQQERAAVTADELASPDIVIEYGDYAAMEQLVASIQNGELDGKVVDVDGYVSYFGVGWSHAIMERNPDDTGGLGNVFVIDGAEDDDEAYPMDEQHARVVGKVGLDESETFFVIHTLPEFVTVFE